MILPLALLLMATTPSTGSVLGLAELPQQVMARTGCALVLWERATRMRVLMATAQPAAARVMREARPVSLALTSAEGPLVLGFAASSRYADAGGAIVVDVVIVPSQGGGAVIRDGTLTVTHPDGVAVIAPVAGLIGCR